MFPSSDCLRPSRLSQEPKQTPPHEMTVVSEHNDTKPAKSLAMYEPVSEPKWEYLENAKQLQQIESCMYPNGSG